MYIRVCFPTISLLILKSEFWLCSIILSETTESAGLCNSMNTISTVTRHQLFVSGAGDRYTSCLMKLIIRTGLSGPLVMAGIGCRGDTP